MITVQGSVNISVIIISETYTIVVKVNHFPGMKVREDIFRDIVILMLVSVRCHEINLKKIEC